MQAGTALHACPYEFFDPWKTKAVVISLGNVCRGNRGVLSLVGIASAESDTACVNPFSFLLRKKKKKKKKKNKKKKA